MSARSWVGKTRRAFCSAVSSGSAEPLTATASRVERWMLIEQGGDWGRDPLEASLFSREVKEHVRAQLAALPRGRLLFVKRPGRRASGAGRVFFVTSRPGEERLTELELQHPDDLLRVDAAAVFAGTGGVRSAGEASLFVVCTHGRRDRCCALQGRPLYDALLRETDPERVWQSTHVGGDRFAGNVVVLPHGLYYGRVTPADAGRVVAAYAAGKVELDRYRGRSVYPFPVQAAEHGLRESAGLLGIDDLELVGVARTGPGAQRVRFRTPDSTVHELHVAETAAEEAAYLTCDSAAPQHARRWRVTAHDVVRP